MKKIFTLISVAMMAISANAQDTKESYVANIEDFNATEVTLNKTENVTIVANAGVIYKYEDPAVKTVSSTEGSWGAKGQGDINFNWVVESTTSAVPFITIGVEEYTNKDTDETNYRPSYEYYNPDGSAGLPVNGEYVKLSVKKDGMFKIGFWAAKNASRKLYLVKESDKKALVWDADASKTEYKVEGYVNGYDEWADAEKTTKRKKFIESIQVNDFVLGDPAAESLTDTNDDGTPKIVNQQNQPKFGWFVFDAKAGETYWVFGDSWQFGFQGYEFTPGATQKDYTPTDPTTGITSVKAADAVNAPVYNLAGQRVNNGYKGVVIQNGKKFMQK